MVSVYVTTEDDYLIWEKLSCYKYTVYCGKLKFPQKLLISSECVAERPEYCLVRVGGTAFLQNVILYFSEQSTKHILLA